MKLNPFVGSLLIILSVSFFLSSQTVSASVVRINGCHKPDSGWLYPESGFNLSGIVDIYWSRAEADYYEHIVYRLIFNSFEDGFRLIDKATSSESYSLDTTTLPQGIGNLSVESFDGYVSNSVSVRVNVNQSLSTTPLDPNNLENPDICSFDDYVTVTTTTYSKDLSLDWLVLFSGILVSIFVLKRFS